MTEIVNCYTSFAPKMQRMYGGKDVGLTYQRNCLENIKAKFSNFFLVNSESEIKPNQYKNYDRVVVRDKRLLVDQKYVKFKALKKHVSRTKPDYVLFLNSDVLYDYDESFLLNHIKAKKADCLIAHRTDFDLGEDFVRRKIYYNGIDLVFAKTEFLLQWLEFDFAFGIPWWDYSIPIWFIQNDKKLVMLSGEGLLHLNHPVQWNEAKYLYGFEEFQRAHKSRGGLFADYGDSLIAENTNGLRDRKLASYAQDLVYASMNKIISRSVFS